MRTGSLDCSDSLSGHTSEAIEDRREAIAAAEKYRGEALVDADFDPSGRSRPFGR